MILQKSKQGQGLAKLILSASYLADFIHKITECSKQGLTLFVISIIQNVLAGFAQKISLQR